MLDPVPAYKRGLNFNAGNYLVSNVNVYLSNEVSVGMWIYVITAGHVFEKVSTLRMTSAGVVTATIESPSQMTTTRSAPSGAFSGWTYLSFAISYSSGSTSLTVYKNHAAGGIVSATNYLYRDTADVIYIGKSSTNADFVGFIY